jgi:NAD(P)-dependent dehydrogenase (short-subunit alcohol dehydrogenase family)
MNLQGKVVVITGGAGGIGSALAQRFAAEGARMVVLADLRAARAREVAAAIGPAARGVGCDVTDGEAVAALVRDVTELDGPIDLYCSNAGIGAGSGLDAGDEEWERVFRVNVAATVAAARALMPGWLERGDGYLLVTASAAGLLTTLGDGAYAASKHAAVGLAEWLAVTYGDRGVKVSCLCPQGVRTEMVSSASADGHLASEQVKVLGLMEPEEVAEAVVQGLAAETFLILPHPEVLTYWRRKTEDPDRWLAGMRRFQARLNQSLSPRG